MIKKISYFLLILLIQISLFSQELSFKIIFTSDSNGRPIPFHYQEQEDAGGYPARATLFEQILKGVKKNYRLILDTGGIVHGRIESNLFKGLADIEAMNQLGYDASGLGFAEIFQSRSHFEALNNNAQFNFLSANVRSFNRRKKQEIITDEYIIKNIGLFKGIKVGLFSVMSEDANQYLLKEVQNEFIVLDPIETARRIVRQLKDEEKVDLIICLSYLGYYPESTRISCRTLAEYVEGIDLIIDGRNNHLLAEPVMVKNTRIFKTAGLGLAVGEIDLTLENNKIKTASIVHHPVNFDFEQLKSTTTLVNDDKMIKTLARRMRRLDKLTMQEIARINSRALSSKGIRDGETSLGNLICDALIDYFEADIAFQNAGGIAEAEIEQDSSLNRTSFNEIIKYDNSVYIALLTGAQIRQILDFSLVRLGYGPFLQIGGIRYIYSLSKKKIVSIKVGEFDLNENKVYKVVFNSWLATGNDGYVMLKEHLNKDDLNITLREVVYHYLEKNKQYIPVVDERVTIIE